MRQPLVVAVTALSIVVAGCAGRPASAPPAVIESGPSNPSPGSGSVPASSQTPATDTAETQDPAGQGQQVPASEPAPADKHEIPNPVRGIHLSGWYAGSPDLLRPLLAWAKEAGINTVVMDLKAEDGKLSWESDIPLAAEIGSNSPKVGDLAAVVREMQGQGFWVAGRIVVMNDQYLYRARPAWTIPGFPGGAYSFMDPKNENVWRYNVDIALAAVAAGVDEIQFDYIRYPEKLVDGYNRDTGPDYRTGAINGFLQQAVAELKPLGVTVSADVFGLTTSVAEGDDMQIGQDYRQIAEIVDYVSPMVYPSHYALGTYGIANPDHSPYETVKESMARALARTAEIPLEKHRPWIQDFTYPGAGALSYGPAQLQAQVRALQELGITSFLLWDPSNKYTRGVDYTQAPQ